jgi:hypothetical protein
MSPQAKVRLVSLLLPLWLAWTGYKFFTRGVAYGDYRFAATMLGLMWGGFTGAAILVVRHHRRLANAILLFAGALVVAGGLYGVFDSVMTRDVLINLAWVVGVSALTWHLVFRVKLPER